MTQFLGWLPRREGPGGLNTGRDGPGTADSLPNLGVRSPGDGPRGDASVVRCGRELPAGAPWEGKRLAAGG